MGFSIPHLLVVLAITVLVFGTKRLRNLGGDLGGAIKSFRTAMKEGEEDTVSDANGSTVASESGSNTEEKS